MGQLSILAYFVYNTDFCDLKSSDRVTDHAHFNYMFQLIVSFDLPFERLNTNFFKFLFPFFVACGVNCHKKCESHMPNLCGVNQKWLAKALQQVRRLQTPQVRPSARGDIVSPFMSVT